MFLWTLMGGVLALGLCLLILGIPVAVFYLSSVRVLALASARFTEALLGVRMPRRMPVLPHAHGWGGRLGALLKDGFTRRCLGYLLLQLPLGLVETVIMYGALALLVSPAMRLFCPLPLTRGSAMLLVVHGTLALLAVPAYLHLALILGRLHGRVALRILVLRQP